MSDGSKVTEEVVKEFTDLAGKLQKAASSNGVKTPYTLFRGESYASEEEMLKAYPKGKKIELQRLTSTATESDIASEYASTGGGGGVQVVVHYGSSNGLLGVQTAPMGVPSNEVVMPKGAKFRVSSIRKEGDRFVVSLYTTEKHKGVKMVNATQ
jgi:hypothetical protein